MNQPPANSSPNHARLYLTGYRGTGKTTVGKILAGRLGGRCIDLDERIESTAGMSIRDIFEAGGEAAFRDWETRCLRALAGPEGCDEGGETGVGPIIALGGGAILREGNRSLIAESGRCVWLVASPKTIAERLTADATTAARRPSLTGLSPTEEVAEVLQVREPLYRQAADFTVDTEARSPPQIAEEVLQWWSAERKRVS